jgi:O-acetyl-ADP-ribose deacetylase (regulator of RNase III)
MRREVRVERCSLLDAGCDVVVNASNPAAALGSGVSRAIFEECGGHVIQEEIRTKLREEFGGMLDLGDCLVTSGGTSTRLRHVLHVASVDYGAEGEGLVSSTARVTKCTQAALERAAELGTPDAPVRLAFPLLAAGHGGLGAGSSLEAIVNGMRAFFRKRAAAPIGAVIFAVPEADKYELVKRGLAQLLVLH